MPVTKLDADTPLDAAPTAGGVTKLSSDAALDQSSSTKQELPPTGLKLLLPQLDVGAVVKGIEGFPAEARREAVANQGKTLAQRALDPSGMQTAEQLATIAGPASLEGAAVPKTGPRPAAVEARQAGYVLPPGAISEKPGLVSQVLAGWGGKIKTQQAASARNQEITNSLAAKALDLPPGTVLSDQAFNAVRAKAGQAYQAVANAIPIVHADQAYDQIVAGLGGANSQAAKLFPKITANPGIKDLTDELKSVRQIPTDAALEIVKELRFNANANLHALGDPSKHALGLAQRQSADAIDDLIERNIQAAGPAGGGLVDQYRQARRLIARSYDVEGATNPGTGDVNARGIARLAAKGRPLTGDLDTIANAAAAFPKAMQMPSGFGHEENMSVLDFFFGVGSAAAGHPEGAIASILRGPARGAALSKPVQNLAARTRPGNPLLSPTAARAIPAFTAESPAHPALPQSITDPYAAQLGGQP